MLICEEDTTTTFQEILKRTRCIKGGERKGRENICILHSLINVLLCLILLCFYYFYVFRCSQCWIVIYCCRYTELLVVKVNGFHNNLICLLFALEFIYFDILVLEFLVILKEPLDLRYEVLR